MKRMIITLTSMLLVMASANAISYKTARSEALFLTDKMAYELNLTDDQYNAAYEINLDYIMDVQYQSDLFGIYWNRRNTEMSYVLTPTQYKVFIATEYFYRPLTWVSNRIRYMIYDRYPKNKFYMRAPAAYETYKGGNDHYNFSPYQGRTYMNKNVQPQPKSNKQPEPTMKKREAVKEGKVESMNKRNTQSNYSNNRVSNGQSQSQRPTTNTTSGNSNSRRR